jgi:L-lactate permease
VPAVGLGCLAFSGSFGPVDEDDAIATIRHAIDLGLGFLDTVLMAATNSSGGVLGKMVSPQNLAIAAAAVGLDGREGDIFRRVVLWSLLFLAGMCLLSGLQSTAVLGWMVP